MSDSNEDSEYPTLAELKPKRRSNRIPVTEIAGRLEIGRLAVYSMLEQGLMPGIRLGRRWIVTRHAYEQWERSCGMRPGSRLEIDALTEVKVVN
jgi:excisionase family DNA binding protein